MASGRGRDLTFSLLSDASKFDTSKAAAQLEDLGDSAKGAGDDLDALATEARTAAGRVETELSDMGREAARRLETLNRDARDVNLEDTLGRDAKATAGKVDDAFDAIARSAKAGSRKVDTETRDMRGSLKDVSDEAGQTSREMAASFGSSGDIGDALQELAANAPAALGPLGLAFGAVAGIGVGLFRARTEALKERVDELVDAMIDAGGRLSKEFVDSEVLKLVKDGEAGRLEELVKRYKLVGVTVRDVVRARAGDEEALKRVQAALATETRRRKSSTDEMGRSEAAVAALSDGITQGADALRLAKEATEDYQNATGDAAKTAKGAAKTAKGAWDDLRANLGRPIRPRVIADLPSASELAAVRSGIMRGIGTIVVPVKPGQSRFANTADNSRYRW